MRLWVLLLLAAAAAAERWERDVQVFASRNGKHTLQGTRREGGSTLEFRHAAGGPTLTVPRRYVEVEMLDREPAAVLFEQHAAAIALVDLEKIRWRVPGEQLHDGAVPLGKVDGRVVWCWTWWVDEARGKVVLVSLDRKVREIDLQSGHVVPAPSQTVLSGIALPHARKRALEVAVELQPKGLREVAAALAADGTEPAAIRLRAALAVQRAGGATAGAELLEAAVARGESREDQAYAVRHAPSILGDAACDWLERVGTRRGLTKPVFDALATLGEKAAPSMAYLVAHGDVTREARRYGAGLLRRMPKDVVLRVTVKEMEDADAELGGLLLSTALAAGAPDVAARVQRHERVLLEILDQETADTGWLADYFRVRPSTEAVKPLLKALRKHRSDRVLAARLIAALKTCTGFDFGRDPADWLREMALR